MNILTTKAAVTVATVATGLAAMASMFTLAPMAYADSSCSFSRDLTVGATGADVTCLQNALIAGGYSIPAGATGFFGTQTKAAVMAWQSAKNIAPAAGYFGPISRAAFAGSAMGGGLPAGCTSTSGYSSTTGQSCAVSTTLPAGCTSNVGFSPTTGQSCSATVTLPAGCTSSTGFSTTTGQSCSSGSTGGALTGSGRLTNIGSVGNVYSDLKEGDSATSVVGVSVDAKDGDVSIQRVDATFDMTGVSGGSTNLNKYVSDVSVWLGDTKLASMDPADGDKSSSVWTYRFSGLNGVVKAGTTGNIYVKVTPVESVGTDEDAKTVTAKLLTDSLRAVGADGISDTYIDSDITNDFTVSSSDTGTLTVTAASDNPKASQVTVGSSTTTGVKLLSFNMKAKNSDVTITDLKASFGTSDNNLNDVVNTVYLMKGSTVVKSKTLSTGTYGTVTFSDVNQTISKDSTVNYTIVADLKGDSAYGDGTTLTASTTVSGWDVEDANGSSVTPSAAAVGNAQTLTATGISLALVSADSSLITAADPATAGSADTRQYTIKFTVTAGDDDVYVDGATGSSHIAFATTTSSTASSTNQGTAHLSVSDSVTGDSVGSYYKVLAGTTRTFTLDVTYTATADGYTGIQLQNINYGTGTSMGSTYSSNLDTFKTPDVFMSFI